MICECTGDEGDCPHSTIFNTKSIIFNTKFMIFDTKFMIFDNNFITCPRSSIPRLALASCIEIGQIQSK